MPRAALAVLVASGPWGAGAAAELTIDGVPLPARAMAVARKHAESVVMAAPRATATWWVGFLETVFDHEPPLLDDSIVVVHEVERALTDDGVWGRVIDAAVDGAVASIPSQPVTDTVRDHHGSLVDRDSLVECQTPRAYRVGLLRDLVGLDSADDLDALTAAGVMAAFVDGSTSASAVRSAEQLAVVSARAGL